CATSAAPGRIEGRAQCGDDSALRRSIGQTPRLPDDAIDAALSESTGGVDRHHLVHAHLAAVDAAVEDRAVQVRLDARVAAHRLAVAWLLEPQVFAAAGRLAPRAVGCDPALAVAVG